MRQKLYYELQLQKYHNFMLYVKFYIVSE